MSVASVINTTIDRSRHTVLVVDDNPATRYSTSRVIRAAGFQTVEAATGEEALQLTAAERVSAIVLDVHLPDIDGFEVCRRLRADPATERLPVIHLSAAHVQDADKVTGLDAGADAYLVHPAEPAMLVATLQALIRARMAEDQVRRSEVRFRAIYDRAPSGMALIDSQGRFADVNPALARMLGKTPWELIGRDVADFAPVEWKAFVAKKMLAVQDDEPSWEAAFALMSGDGELRHLEWSMSSHVEPSLRLGVAVDVSERRELELRRQEVLEREQAARVTAERHSRTKDDFVAVLSHELRTPLNAIAGWVHLLQKHGAKPEHVGKAMAAIERSVKAQTQIISDILDVSRVNAGKLRLYPEWVDARSLVDSALEALHEPVRAKGVQLRVHSDDASMARPAWLDPTRFQQIVWNLVTNAVKFSQPNGPVDVTLSREGAQLRLTVRDAGKGIPQEFMEHLFSRFTQSDAPGNRQHGGLGLGLSIVRHLTELHGGQVSASSAGENQGATFEVVLPVEGSDAPVLVVDRTVESQDQSPLAGCSVLVVEDNPDAAELAQVVLQDAGAQVRVATDYASALAALSQAWPQALVSDIGLPGQDGYDLVREVRRLGQAEGRPRLLAVALTAFSRDQDRARALEAGFDAHIAKPLQAHQLIHVLVNRPAG
ncbi:response regulator [Variovorax sp. OV329]|uniref:hybrid sensor histidine kinase/response regulator n=1 Tax=Variovorax sp. OV329 TaxID=1882825 RepID=UPI0008E9EEFA|nr:response regulator [Variovorax sp. OV329]SFM58499.1 PAS/PAC sensor hybrid histidine kinase [Variovorax sp. OV329]